MWHLFSFIQQCDPIIQLLNKNRGSYLNRRLPLHRGDKHRENKGQGSTGTGGGSATNQLRGN